MWDLSISHVIALAIAIIAIIQYCWNYKWRNPKFHGKLPPGSMGLPLIGETIQFFIPSKSLDLHPFLKKRMKKYGPVFKTNVVGRPVVISADAEFNHFILQQEGKLVEFWYLDAFAEITGQDGLLKQAIAPGQTYKYIKKLISEHLGIEVLKANLLSDMEVLVTNTLCAWRREKYVEVRLEIVKMILHFTSKLTFGYNVEKSGESLSDLYAGFMQGLMSLPLNIPGTAFHMCLQKREKILKIVRNTMEERQASHDQETTRGKDFLDSLMDEMKADNISLSENMCCFIIFALVLANVETLPNTLTMAIKFLTENPPALEQLVKEHEDIIRRRESTKSGITWQEYKSMTFTRNVINEALRVSGSAPLLRRIIRDVHYNGYVIPKGWTIAVEPLVQHLNPDVYKDPLTFNPWRWQELGPSLTLKNFLPFGGGMRSCSGAEFSKAIMAVFLHVFVTNYKWSMVKGGEVSRSPMLGFGDGYYINFQNR